MNIGKQQLHNEISSYNHIGIYYVSVHRDQPRGTQMQLFFIKDIIGIKLGLRVHIRVVARHGVGSAALVVEVELAFEVLELVALSAPVTTAMPVLLDLGGIGIDKTGLAKVAGQALLAADSSLGSCHNDLCDLMEVVVVVVVL